MVPVDVTLSWTPGTLAAEHDVYFGIDEAAVENATKASPQYKATVGTAEFGPPALEEAATYYWRIDEVNASGTVKGDLWQFTTVGALVLNFDFALPLQNVPDSPIHPLTAKEGYYHWAAPRWFDMRHHDMVWDGPGGAKSGPEGIAGTGIHAAVTQLYEGQICLRVRGMCQMDHDDDKGYLNPPTGAPEGDPIANTWLMGSDWAGDQNGDVWLGLYDLPPGEYTLKSYHNFWYYDNRMRECTWEDTLNQDPMPQVAAIWIGAADNWYAGKQHQEGGDVLTGMRFPDALWKISGGGELGYGDVKLIEDDFNIDCSHTLNDDEVTTSTIGFSTDGSAVLIIYDSPNGARDPYRDYPGGRGILNAFELALVKDITPACSRIDSFEQYADDVELQVVWAGGGGAYAELTITEERRRGQSLKLTYYNGSGFAYSDVAIAFEETRNWTGLSCT